MEKIVFFYPDLLCNALFYPSEGIVIHRVHRAGLHTLTQWTPPVNSWIIPWVRALTVSHQIVGMIFTWSFTWVSLSSNTCTILGFVLFYLRLFDLDTLLIKFFCLLTVHGDKEHALLIPASTCAISLCASHGETNRKKKKQLEKEN